MIYISVQHWANTTIGDLFWRIPIGTQYDMQNVKVVVSYGNNWMHNKASFSILREDLFTRFTAQALFATQINISKVSYEFTDIALMINLRDIPVDYHFMFIFTAKINDGDVGIKAGNEYYTDAILTGNFVTSADNSIYPILIPTT